MKRFPLVFCLLSVWVIAPLQDAAAGPADVTYNEENGYCVTSDAGVGGCTGTVENPVVGWPPETPKVPAGEFEVGPSIVLEALPPEASPVGPGNVGSIGTPFDPFEVDPFGPLATQLASQKVCTYNHTSYAAGGRSEGDEAFFGVDNRLGAHAAARSHSGPLYNGGLEWRGSNAWAAAGLEVRYAGGFPVDVTFIMPWISAGHIRTSTECSIAFECTEARGSFSVQLIVRDITSGSILDSITVFADGQEGSADRPYGREGQREFSLTFRPNHSYRAFIRVDVGAGTKGEIRAPLEQADAVTDWFGGGGNRGAYLKHIKLRMDSPGYQWAYC